MRKYSLMGLIFLLVFMLFNVAVALDEAAGGENDPIVTQSYIEMRLEQLKTYVDEKFNNVTKDLQNIKSDINVLKGGDAPNNAFEPVTLAPGQKIIGGEGTELILRVGNAKAIASAEGGLADVTGAVDISNGKDIPRQHLLIIPREDGRGAYTSGSIDAIFMVKGPYIIQ